MMHHMKIIDPPRELTVEERSFLDRLLMKPFPGRDELQEQVSSVRVSGECTCGCRSIVLTVNKSLSQKALVTRRIPIEAEGIDIDGITIHFLLHVVDGFLSELEIFREDSKSIQRLPDYNSLELLCLDD